MSKMSIETKLRVTEIQRFCMHDGPGVRTTVFLKGCPLRCAWCHNPETQRAEPELLLNVARCIGCLACVSVCPSEAQAFDSIRTVDRDNCRACGACAEVCPTAALEVCGREYTAGELADVIERDRAFYGERGGVTLSGGEPLLQGEGILALLRECRERGIPTAVETCGFADPSVIEAAVPHVDLFLWDVKDTDDVRHKRYTGVSSARIIENLLEQTPACPRMLSDKFGSEHLIRNALMSRGKQIILDQETKAERDVAVAAASILARDGFLRGMKKLDELCQCELPRGAGPQVKVIGSELVRKHGREILSKCAKLHFKTASEL